MLRSFADVRLDGMPVFMTWCVNTLRTSECPQALLPNATMGSCLWLAGHIQKSIVRFSP